MGRTRTCNFKRAPAFCNCPVKLFGQKAHPTKALPVGCGQGIDLTSKLQTLLELAPEERQALGLAARRAVVERFSWPAVAARLLEPFV